MAPKFPLFIYRKKCNLHNAFMVRRLSTGKNNHLTCYSLAINPRNVSLEYAVKIQINQRNCIPIRVFAFPQYPMIVFTYSEGSDQPVGCSVPLLSVYASAYAQKVHFLMPGPIYCHCFLMNMLLAICMFYGCLKSTSVAHCNTGILVTNYRILNG